MDQRTVTEVVSQPRNAILQDNIDVEHIALFGSALSDNLRSDSDIDLIIISKDFAGKDLFARSRITMNSEVEVLLKFKIPMDVFNLTPEGYDDSIIKKYYPIKIVA